VTDYVGSPSVDTMKQPTFRGKMKARYTGTCHNCQKSIEVGDEISSDYDNWTAKWKAVHDDCNNPASLRLAKKDTSAWPYKIDEYSY